jgi:hypothetical protein
VQLVPLRLGHIPEDDFAAREAYLEEAQYAKIDAMIARLKAGAYNRTFSPLTQLFISHYH